MLHFSGDISFAIKSTVQKLLDIQRASVLTTIGSHVRVGTELQAAIGFHPRSKLEQVILELLIDRGLAAEKLAPGSFQEFIKLLALKLGLEHNQIPPSNSGGGLGALGYCPHLKDINAELSRLVEEPMTLMMLKRALDLAGFGGKIIVEKTMNRVPSVELVIGYTFNLTPAWDGGDVTLVRPRVACLDGHVEEVSELHHLLEEACSSRESCVLFLRGLSNDVKHTLRINYDRGSLAVIPVVVPFDLSGMNTLVDIAVVGGGDVVSSLKGDLISSVKLSSLPIVDKVFIHSSSVAICNSSTSQRVRDHVADLTKRRENEDVDEKAALLDARARSLTPNHVIIRIPDDHEFVRTSQTIDRALRSIRSMVQFGLAEPGGRPLAAQLAATNHAERCFSELSKLGCIITAGA